MVIIKVSVESEKIFILIKSKKFARYIRLDLDQKVTTKVKTAWCLKSGPWSWSKKMGLELKKCTYIKKCRWKRWAKKNERAEKSKNHHRDLQKIIKKLNHDLKKSKPHFSHIDPLFRLRVKNLAFCLLFKNPLKPHLNKYTIAINIQYQKPSNLTPPNQPHPFLKITITST